MSCLRLSVVVLLLGVVTATAQTTSGSMSGSVVDESSQGVPGATVTILNEATGEERTGLSNEVGTFTFPALVAGPYTIRVSMDGFRPLEVRGRVVLANNRLAVGALRLEVGQVTEEVSVTARGETVATATTSHQAVMDLEQVTNLSIRGRDPISLLKILPGVQMLPNDQETFGGSFATPVPQIQGGRGQTIYVDGVNGGDGGGGGNFSGATNLDAIQEVNVQMSTYTAEYGLKGGAQVNFITKRGGSNYRGTAYTYQRFTGLNATPYFNHADHIPKPEYRYSTVGGNLGGPIPRIPKLNGDGQKLFFFYSLDDTRLKNPQTARRFTVPTALERAGDFSQTRTSSGALIVVRDPLTGQPFPGNVIPADRADPRGLAMLNLLPLPNTTGVGYNFVDQEASIPAPRRQHLLRLDYRPTQNDSFSVKGQSWFTNSVGINVAGASARWGLVRQRYDFTADQIKADYTRIISSNTVLEAGFGKFYSTELGPPEDDIALAGIQRSSYPALAGLGQFAPVHNPLNLIPKVRFGTLQNNSSTDLPDIVYDNRWPITGADTALVGSLQITHTRGDHTFKAGFLREHERFTQARAGIFGGEFNFQNDGADPLNTGFAFANAYIGHVTSYTESMGRRPDNRWQTTWAWFVQDTWKPTRKLTLDAGVRMYKWDDPVSATGEASAFSFERFDPTWGGRPPVLYRPVTTPQGRRALNPLTGAIVPVTFVGQMVPGSGFTCGVITPDTPCQINGIVVERNGDYVDGGVGFIESPGIQFDPRFGLAFAFNPKTVMRVGVGAFHDGTGGPDFRGGPAFEFNRVINYTDMDSYLTGTGSVSPINVSGIERENQKRPVSYRYQVGFEREVASNIVVNLAYVGDTTRNIPQNWNYNAVPAGAQFLPENRDATVPDSATVGLQPNKPNPGALPDVFLRPILGFGDINISRPTGRGRYDSLQLQVSRRFTGGFELAGSYTYAKASETILGQNNPLPSRRQRSLTVQPHVAVISYIVDVPNGTKLIKWQPARWVVDNWQVSGISSFATGAWSNVTATYTDSFNFSGGGDTCGNLLSPGQTAGQPLIQTGDANLSRGERTQDRWFDTSVFQRPSARGQIGNNCNEAKVLLPGFNNHDLTIFKNFPVRGRHKMQLRWEIYNLFNHPQWATIDTTAQFNAAGEQTDRAFGTALTARTERRMQVSLRYEF
jgi:hypothetical protein